MDGTQTSTADTPGTQTDKPVATDAPNTDTPQTPTSLYDKTEAIVTRQEAANKEAKEILDRQETLHANQRLAGTTGGQVVPEKPEQISDSDYADKLMKGEANPLGEDGISLN